MPAVDERRTTLTAPVARPETPRGPERAERDDEYGADHDALVMIGAGTQVIAVSGIAWDAAA